MHALTLNPCPSITPSQLAAQILATILSQPDMKKVAPTFKIRMKIQSLANL
jgi:hypothetical protein